jgi:Holliday junction resolvase RusA-like endonuclease
MSPTTFKGRDVIIHNVVNGGSFTLDLPMPPSVNRIPHRLGNASRQVQTWRRQADKVLLTQGRLPNPMEGEFHLVITWDNRYDHYDIDNGIKPLMDYLQHLGLIRNDSDCRKLTVSFGNALEGCRVTCMEINDA